MKIYEYIVRIKDQASDKLRKLGSGISNGARRVDRFNDSLKETEKTTNSLGGAASFLARYLGPAVLGGALLHGALTASKFSRELEQTKISFEVMLGSAGKAKVMLEELTEMANVTPFTRRELQDSSKLLLNFGVDAKKILPSLKMLGDISGGNADKLYHLTLAFAQSSAAGRLMGQDLLQMVNAGFNPLQEISKKTGISLVKLKEKMEDGAISTRMVEAAFKSATAEGGQFFNMMELQSKTFEGRLSTLRDKSEIFITGIGDRLNEAFSPILDKLIKKVDELTDKIGSVKNENEIDVKGIRTLTIATSPLVERYDELIKKKNEIGLSAKEQKEILSTFEKLSKALPIANIYDKKTGAIKEFDTQNAKDFIWGEQGRFKERVDERIKDLKNQMSDVETLMQGKTPGVMGWGQTMKKFVSPQEMSKLTSEKNRILGLIDELNSTKKNAFVKLTEDKSTDTGDPYKDLFLDTKKKKKDGLDKITGGGKQAINVTINLENLIGVQKFDVTNVKESVRDMEKQTVEALLRVLNSANYAAAQ